MRIGTDVGGTFTDLVAIRDDGQVSTQKVATVPEDQSRGFETAVRAASTDAAGIVDVTHGSTVGVNALLERETPEIALLCTEGHRDVLEIRRTWREHLFGNEWVRPPALVRRRLRLEVPERINAQGEVTRELDEDVVRAHLADLNAEGITAAAVAFLNAHVNSQHEERVLEIAAAEFPELQLVRSSAVLPEIGEYERTSTTTVGAMLRPVMDDYLGRLTSRLNDVGAHNADLRIMRSNGALMTLDAARANPVATLMSGPAGGVRACVEIGRATQQDNVLTLDMGGTSTEVALIDSLRPLEARERDLAWNIPIRTAMLDIRSIGAGGGSIAFVDAGGALQVGPQSAGAQPGPACYGRGGTEPTVTDAALLLGWIAPDAFLGGDMVLDRVAAESALAGLATSLSLEVVEAAAAVIQIALAHMALLVREASVNRGYDPREFTLIPFGGAGPLVATAIADDLSIRRVCVPRHASVLSALGGLMGEIAYDYGRSYSGTLRSPDMAALASVFDALRVQAEDRLKRDGLVGARFELSLDLHYVGSSHSLSVPLTLTEDLRAALDACASDFAGRHSKLYSFVRPHDDIEIAAVRIRATVARPKPSIAPWTEGHDRPAPIGERPIYFTGQRRRHDTPIYARDSMAAGSQIEGPAVIQEADTATIVLPAQHLQVDSVGNLVIEIGDSS